MLTSFSRDLELVDGLETDYLRLLYYDLAPGFSSDYKSYEYSRLCTILEGKKRISVNSDNKLTYNSNQFIVLPSHSGIHMDIEVPTRALVFELNDELLKKVTEKISVDYEVDFDALAEDRFFLGKVNGEIGSCLDKITKVAPKPHRNEAFLLDLYAQELVYNLVRIKGIQQILDLEHDNPVHKAIKCMQENFRQPICLKELASDLKMSDANFSQYFKKIMGITPKDYLTGLKLSKAREMLQNQSVTEVAFDLGYENISHFISLFKNRYGVTPKQYKKRAGTDLHV